MKPHIKTKLPGTKAKKLIEKDERYTSPSYTRVYPLVVKRAHGAMIEDVDGNKFLDFTSGIAVCNTGHCHKDVVKAIHDQSSKLIHMSGTDFYYEPMGRLAKELARITPGNFKKRVFFTNSGAEAIEAAFKLARYKKRRPRMIAFLGAFHGRTMGALSLTGSKIAQIDGFAPLVPEVTHVPYPYCYRCPYNLAYNECEKECVRFIEDVLFKESVPPDEVAAIFVEPIQGEGGYIVPPPEFHPLLKKLCKKYDILYIADEIQSGMGRTGKMFAIEHWGVTPDVLCLAKGLASGMPLGAIVTPSSLMTWGKGAHSTTFGGNPISCRASLETIKLLEAGLIKNAQVVGDYLIERLGFLMERFHTVGDVRGKGLMVGVEIVKDKTTKEKAQKERNRIVQKAFERGLLLLGCGENSIRFSPPLTITKDDVDVACDIFEDVLSGF